MLHCPAHQAARQRLRNSMGGRNIDITKLFTTSKPLQALFAYIAETGRFTDTFGELPRLEKDTVGGRRKT